MLAIQTNIFPIEVEGSAGGNTDNKLKSDIYVNLTMTGFKSSSCEYTVLC
jgi:hypothetical protein